MRKHRFSRRFEKSFAHLPEEAAELFEKKLQLFLENPRHPSFRTKKMQGFHNPDVYEGSLTMDYRFTFEIESDGTILFRNIGHHAILDKGNV